MERDAWDKACDQVLLMCDGGRLFTCNVSELWCMTCDTQGRVKKIRPVKWTEGGEDRSQVLPFDILPCFFAAPFLSIPHVL